jgi:hypothetical protein
VASAGRFTRRLLLAGALGAGAYLAWVSSAGSPAPIDLVPSGAISVLEVRDAESLTRRLSGTRFAAAFAQSATREWLERTDAVRAFDSIRSEVGRITGVRPSRASAFDLLGAEAAIGWYPPAEDSAAAPLWVAGGRLSIRAWVIASALRFGVVFGLGPAGVGSEKVAGRVVYSLPGSPGESLSVFLAGRVLVGGPDRELVLRAARAAGDSGASVTREPSMQSIRAALPSRGELFVWARNRGAIPGSAAAGCVPGRGSVGARLRAGTTIEIDVAAEPASASVAGGENRPLPGIALLRRTPLLMVASSDPVPSLLTDLLQDRVSAVVRRSRGTPAPTAPLQPGSGFAVAVTDAAGGTGLFPAPRGLVMIGMASAAESVRALPLLFPPGARSASGGGNLALTTRESIPLAGAFDLWGAAIGPHLVFATDTSLIDAVRADPAGEATVDVSRPPWQVRTVATISMDKTLPLLRRWAAPLSGLVVARWPEMPNVVRDLGLLGAIGTVRLAAGSDEQFDRAAITLDVHDLAGR